MLPMQCRGNHAAMACPLVTKWCHSKTIKIKTSQPRQSCWGSLSSHAAREPDWCSRGEINGKTWFMDLLEVRLSGVYLLVFLDLFGSGFSGRRGSFCSAVDSSCCSIWGRSWWRSYVHGRRLSCFCSFSGLYRTKSSQQNTRICLCDFALIECGLIHLLQQLSKAWRVLSIPTESQEMQNSWLHLKAVVNIGCCYYSLVFAFALDSISDIYLSNLCCHHRVSVPVENVCVILDP